MKKSLEKAIWQRPVVPWVTQLPKTWGPAHVDPIHTQVSVAVTRVLAHVTIHISRNEKEH